MSYTERLFLHWSEALMYRWNFCPQKYIHDSRFLFCGYEWAYFTHTLKDWYSPCDYPCTEEAALWIMKNTSHESLPATDITIANTRHKHVHIYRIYFSTTCHNVHCDTIDPFYEYGVWMSRSPIKSISLYEPSIINQCYYPGKIRLRHVIHKQWVNNSIQHFTCACFLSWDVRDNMDIWNFVLELRFLCISA